MCVAFIRTLTFALTLFPALAIAQIGVAFPGPGMPALTSTPFSITNTDTGTDNTAGNTITFTSKSIGTPDASRKIIVAIGERTATVFATSVTVDGISAASVSNSVTLASNNASEIWVATVGTDSGHTTGNIVITYSAGPARLGIGVYSMLGQNAGPNAAHFTTSGTNPATATVTVPSGGAAVGAGASQAAGQTTATAGPSGFATDASLVPAANTVIGVAHSAAGALTGSQNLTMQWNIAGTQALSVVAYGP
jgi:hypothetical protein